MTICLLNTISILGENKQFLVVELKSGIHITLPITERPKITFDGTMMSIGNGDYQIENVRKWMVGDPEEIAQSVEIVKTQDAIRYNDGVLIVGADKNVHICNAAGVEMPVSVRNGQVDMRALPADIYLIRVGKETLKIRKK